MSSPFMGEIRMIAFNYPAKGFAFANGQSLPINQNQALYSLLGTVYGGNGQTTFNLPNLQGRSALHFGNGAGGSYPLGQQGGEAFHALSITEIPSHYHTANVSATGGLHPAADNLPGDGNQPLYDPAGGANVAMNNGVISPNGGGSPHENRMPFLTINFVIALNGIFPSRN